MLHATPCGLFTWGFTILQDGNTIADIDSSWLGERADIKVEGQTYSAYRESLLAGTFVLQSGSTSWTGFWPKERRTTPSLFPSDPTRASLAWSASSA
jgi:hypothetical protein